MSLGRYLSPLEKAREMTAWAKSDLADPGIRPLMDRLNSIAGVCTVQSCIGHVHATRADGTRHVENGHVEMRLDERATWRFYAAMPTLVRFRGVEDACIHWRAGEERCTVWFYPGNVARVVEAIVLALEKEERQGPQGTPPQIGDLQC